MSIIFLSFPCCFLSGDTVLHQFRAGEPDPQLENILYLSAGVALTQAGFSSIRKGDVADYILLTEYSFVNSKINIRYTLFTPPDPGNVLATEERSLSFDYDLDEQITGVVKHVLDKAGIKATTSSEPEIGEILPEIITKENDNSENSDSQDITLPFNGGDENGETTGKHPVHFDSSVSGALVILLGDISEYLRFGAAGVLTAGYPFSLGSWSITLGAKLLFTRVFNKPDVIGGPLYLPAAGLNLEFGTSPVDRSLLLSAGISGGAALIAVAGSEEPLIKTVPYADIGVHTGVFIGENLYLGGEVSFFMIFDQDVLIMGVSPTLVLSLGV